MYQNNATKVLTCECRLSYCHLTAPHKNDRGEMKFGVTLLIPKHETATIEDLRSSMHAAYELGVTKKWGGARPQGIPELIYDGDGLRKNGTPFSEECRGHYVLTATSNNKPQVVGIDNIKCELAPQDIYSGMYGRVTLNFFPFATSGSKGVACGLGNVLKTRDGEPLAGGASAATDFDGIVPQAPQFAQPQVQYAQPQAQYAQPQAQPQFAQPQYAQPQAQTQTGWELPY